MSKCSSFPRHAAGAAVVGWQPVLGALSDRFGRRPIVLASNLGLGLDYIFMALAPSLTVLFVGRLISGATAASSSRSILSTVST